MNLSHEDNERKEDTMPASTSECDIKEQEIKVKKTVLRQLQKMLGKERQSRIIMDDDLRQEITTLTEAKEELEDTYEILYLVTREHNAIVEEQEKRLACEKLRSKSYQEKLQAMEEDMKDQTRRLEEELQQNRTFDERHLLEEKGQQHTTFEDRSIAYTELEENTQENKELNEETMEALTSKRHARKQEFEVKKTALRQLQKMLGKERQSRIIMDDDLSQEITTLTEAKEELEDTYETLYAVTNEHNAIIEEQGERLKSEQLRSKSHQDKLEAMKKDMEEQLCHVKRVCSEVEESLRSERMTSASGQKEIEKKDNAINEQRLLLEEELQKKTALKRKVRKLKIQIRDEISWITMFVNTRSEQRQGSLRSRIDEELSEARSAFNEVQVSLQNELAQMRQTLNNEILLRKTKERELIEKETSVVELQKTLSEEQQEKRRVREELSQARAAFSELKEELLTERLMTDQSHEEKIKTIEKVMNETKRNLEEERQEKKVLKEKLRSLKTQLKKFEVRTKTLDEEQQKRIRVEKELIFAKKHSTEMEEKFGQAVSAHEEQEGRLRQELSVETSLRNLREQELEEARLGVEKELSQVRRECVELEQRLLRLEQENTTLLDELTNLQYEMNEERATGRELQSALSQSREELTEYQRRQPRNWVLQRDEISVGEIILGKGAWGIVRKGTFRGSQVAIKELHELILSSDNRELFEREMDMASCCRHPNLLQFIGATNDEGSPLFVTELLDRSLRKLIEERALNHEEIGNLALDVAKGLNYLHLNKPLPIVHQDISSANVLLWKRGNRLTAKLSDYGSASFVSQVTTVDPGAIIYAAPEARALNVQLTTKVKLIFFIIFM